MKLRFLTSISVLAMLLAATGCGTGNLANNAYRVARPNRGIVRERDGNVVNRNLNRTNYGRAMNDAGRTANRNTATRLGNAAHNARNSVNHNTNTTNRTINRTAKRNSNRIANNTHTARPNNTHNVRQNTGIIQDGVNYNANGKAYDGTPNGITTSRGADGRIISQRNNAGAYQNPHNFQNTVYRGHGYIDGTHGFDSLGGYNGVYEVDIYGQDVGYSQTVSNRTNNPSGRTLVNNVQNTQNAKITKTNKTTQHEQGYLTSDNSAFDGKVAQNNNTAAPAPTQSAKNTNMRNTDNVNNVNNVNHTANTANMPNTTGHKAPVNKTTTR